jgi:hypothetical protein
MGTYYLPLEARTFEREALAKEQNVTVSDVTENECIERCIFEKGVFPDREDSDNWQIDMVEEEGGMNNLNSRNTWRQV